MARVIPDGFAEARWVQTFPGDPDPWINTMGYDLTAFLGTPEEIAEVLYNHWRLRILIGQSSSLRLERCDLIVGNGSPFPASVSFIGGHQGGLAGNVLPQNSAVLVHKRTAFGGRRNRGRMFVPAMLGEAVVDNVGVITPAARTDFQNQFNNLLLDNRAANLDPVILHSEGISPVTPPTNIATLQVDGRISTQRRRLR